MAAVLACGPGAVLSHRSALELWGVAKMSRRRPSVTVPGVRRTREKIDVHRSATLTPDDLTAVDAIPCTTLARTLLDFAEIARPKELARAVEDAERIRIFDGHAVERVLSRANGRRGATKLRTALDNWTEPAFTRSEAERMMLALIARAGLPTPNANAFVAGHEVDLHWPQQRLVVEIDSRAWHTSAAGPGARPHPRRRLRRGRSPRAAVHRQADRARPGLRARAAQAGARDVRDRWLTAAQRTPPPPRSASARRSRCGRGRRRSGGHPGPAADRAAGRGGRRPR